MDKQPRVETVDEFKLRIAAIIRAKPEQIPGAPRPNPLLGPAQEAGEVQKSTTSLGSGFMHLYEVRPRKDRRGFEQALACKTSYRCPSSNPIFRHR
jgi:hypothetical protein